MSVQETARTVPLMTLVVIEYPRNLHFFEPIKFPCYNTIYEIWYLSWFRSVNYSRMFVTLLSEAM